MTKEVRPTALDGEIRDGRHVMAVRVYYEDTDFSGNVYHASYLRFMERGRTNYLRLLGADQRALFEPTEKEAPGFAFVVRSMQIEFLKSARMDDLLEIVTATEEVKGASILLSNASCAVRMCWSRRVCGWHSCPAAGRGRSRRRCATRCGRTRKRSSSRAEARGSAVKSNCPARRSGSGAY